MYVRTHVLTYVRESYMRLLCLLKVSGEHNLFGNLFTYLMDCWKFPWLRIFQHCRVVGNAVLVVELSYLLYGQGLTGALSA